MSLIVVLAKIALVMFGILTAAAYFVLLERRVAAWVQDRLGPNRVGIPLTQIRMFGLGQPLADGVKMMLKEEYTPAHVDARLFVLAPIAIMTASLSAYAVIPLGSVIPPIPALGLDSPTPLIIAPALDVALLYAFAVSSIAVYGVILGGWASNSKYSFLGGLRSSAQMISYELPLGLAILGVVLASSSLRLDEIITIQAQHGWHVLMQPLGCIVFMIASVAEAGRLPFDLPESEQELVGGYHTEYSGMKLVLYLTAEFIHMITASFLIVILFLGGWHLPWLTGDGTDASIGWGMATFHMLVLMAKTFLVIFLFMMIRWTWPRFRFDQLLALAWKVMLPLGALNFVAVAILTELQHLQIISGRWSALTIALAGWIVMLAGWTLVAISRPLIADNRPRTDIERYEVDSQI
jgi:NADH-quinone oxidoreductase subunit H